MVAPSPPPAITAAELADRLDRLLLKLLTEGTPLIDRRTRRPVLDEAGAQMMAPPSPPYLAVVLARIKHLERTAGKGNAQVDFMAEAARAARHRRLRFAGAAGGDVDAPEAG